MFRLLPYLLLCTTLVAQEPVAWWPFEGDYRDRGPQLGHGRPLRGVGFAPGRIGSAMSLNGRSSLLRIPTQERLRFGSDDFTITLWLQTPITNSGGQPGILASGWAQPSNPGSWALLADTNGYGISFHAIGPQSKATVLRSDGLTDGWHHLAIIRQGTQLRLCVDGAEVDQQSTDAALNLQGGPYLDMGLAGGVYAGCLLDEVKLFHSALTDEQVKAERNRQLTRPGAPSFTLLEPDGAADLADDRFRISWLAKDEDSQARISLFSDDDQQGRDGKLIERDLIETDGPGYYDWDTSQLEPGHYYIYAVVQDGQHPAHVVYSDGAVKVVHKKDDPEFFNAESTHPEPAVPTEAPLPTPKVELESDQHPNTPSQQFLWVRELKEAGGNIDQRMLVTAAGHVLVTGSGWVARAIGPQGQLLWQVPADGPRTDTFRGFALTQSESGEIWVTGTFSGQINLGGRPLTSHGGEDIFVAKLLGDGQLKEAWALGGTSDDRGRSIALDHQGRIWVTGSFTESLSLSPTMSVLSLGGQDCFVAMMDGNGNPLWLGSLGGKGNDQGDGIHAAADRIIITGIANNEVSFGRGLRTGSTGDWRFLAAIALPKP